MLALVEGEVNLIGADLRDACRRCWTGCSRGGGELVTLLVGAGAPAGLADALTGHLRAALAVRRGAGCTGGQPHYPLLVGWNDRRTPGHPLQDAGGREDRPRPWPTSSTWHRVGDLVYHFPRRYDERGEHTDIAALAVGEEVTVLAQVQRTTSGRCGSAAASCSRWWSATAPAAR